MARPRATQEALRQMATGYGSSPTGGHADAWRLTVATAAAYVLALGWPRQGLTRATLAATMPPDDDMGGKLIHALRYFESRAWVDVGSVAVFVHEPDELRDYALSGSIQPLGLRDFCNVRAALAVIDADDSGANGERALRHQERAYLASRV